MQSEALLDLIKRRRSVRRYDSRPVENEKILLLLEAIRLAPSSCNIQPWRVVVVDDGEMIRRLSYCAPIGTRVNRWMETAPLVFVLCADPHAVLHRAAGWVGSDCHDLDIGIAGEHLCLMATALGLGSCWIGWFSQRDVRKLLAVPRNIEIKALVSVGYPAAGIELDKPSGSENHRRSVNELAWRGRFQGAALAVSQESAGEQ